MRITLERKMIAGLGVILFLIALIGFVSHRTTSRFLENSNRMAAAQETRYRARDVLFAMDDLETGMRGYVITGDVAYLDPYRAATASIGNRMAALSPRIEDDPELRTKLATLRQLVASELAYSNHTIESRKSQGFEQAALSVRTGTGKQMMDSIRQVLGGVDRAEQESVARQEVIILKRAHQTHWINSIAWIFSTIAVAGACMAIRRDLTKRRRVEVALRASETQLQAIIENISEAVVVSDLSGRLLHFNQAALDALGYGHREEGRRAFGELADTFELSGVDGTDWTVNQWPMARILRGEKLHELEGRMRRIGEDWNRVYNFGGTIARDTGGKPLMAVCTFSDITERRQAESAALLLAAIVESSTDAVVGKDLNGVVTSWNAAAESMFGYSAAEIVGRSIKLIIPPNHYDDEQLILSRIKRGERIEHFETERLRKDGGLIDVSVTVSPIKDYHGRVIGASKVARDITERKQTADSIRQLNAHLEQRVIERTAQMLAANNELEAFSYSVSHDLRAPLRTLDGFSQALLEDCSDKLDAEGQDYLRRIRSASQRMGHLIDDLLNLSRLTRTEMNLQEVDLSTMAREVADELRAADPQRQAEFAIAEGLVAQADPQLLRIALTNLFANAWKFSAKRSDARIEFGCDGDDGDKAFFVRDNGVGFDMAYVGKLFGAFQRLHAMHEFAGTGIGLTIVQRIILRHGGRIWADGAVDAGATFHFTL